MAKSREKKKSKPKPKLTTSPKGSRAAAAAPPQNEAQIAVHWKEEELFHPSAKFIGQANLNDPGVAERFT